MSTAELHEAPTAPRPPADHGPSYLLGSDSPERDRLDLQAAYYRMATVDAMHWAGLSEGMRVLDIGSGTGAVACEAARIVGSRGVVLGLDASAEAVAAATARAEQSGLRNVSFQVADLQHWSSPERFDALTGRLISMYLPDPGRTVAALARQLRPGGVVLLEEFAMSSLRQHPETPVLRAAMDRVIATFAAVGIPTDLGFALGEVFRAAGLGTPRMRLGGCWEDGPDAVGYSLLSEATRTLAPAMIRYGLATAEELDIAALEAELRTAAAEVGAGFHPPLLVSAWARTPS